MKSTPRCQDRAHYQQGDQVIPGFNQPVLYTSLGKSRIGRTVGSYETQPDHEASLQPGEEAYAAHVRYEKTHKDRTQNIVLNTCSGYDLLEGFNRYTKPSSGSLPKCFSMLY